MASKYLRGLMSMNAQYGHLYLKIVIMVDKWKLKITNNSVICDAQLKKKTGMYHLFSIHTHSERKCVCILVFPLVKFILE